MAKRNPIAIELKPGRYVAVVVFMILLHIFLLFTSFFWHILGGIQFGNHTMWNSYWLLALLVAYDVVSVRSAQTDESAGITVLEREAIETGRGLKYAPPGLTELHKFPRAIQENQFPSEPENISKRPDDQKFDKTLFDPMRITTAGPEPGSDDSDMLDVRLTLEPTATVFWQVEEEGFFEFYINIPGKHWPEKRAFLVKMMRDSIEAQLRIEFIQYTASELLKNQKKITDEVEKQLSLELADMGVTICSVMINGLEPDHATNTAMGKVPQARATRIATIHEAEGKKQEKILLAEGDARATELAAGARKIQLAAEGEGNKVAADALGMDTNDYIASLVAREAIGKGDLILGEAGVAQVVGLGKLIFKDKGGAA